MSPRRILRVPGEYTSGELANYLGVNRETLLKWLSSGRIPEPQRRGRDRIWTQEEADALKSRVRTVGRQAVSTTHVFFAGALPLLWRFRIDPATVPVCEEGPTFADEDPGFRLELPDDTDEALALLAALADTSGELFDAMNSLRRRIIEE